MTMLSERILLALAIGLAVAVVIWILALVLGRPLGLSREKGAQVRRAVAFALVGAIAAGAAGLATVFHFPGPGTPAPPPTITDPTALEQREAVLEYARGLEYDSVTHGATDLQHLTVAVVNAESDTVALPLGPLAAIYPESKAHRNKLGDLLEGRIVGRIWVDEPGYEKLGLRPGVNWVWVDSLRAPDAPTTEALPVVRDLGSLRAAARTQLVREGATAAESLAVSGLFGVAFERALAQPQGRPEDPVRREARRNPPSDTVRAVIIPDDMSSPVAVRTMYLFRRAHEPFNTPLARWVFRDDDDGSWFNCGKDACCCEMCLD